MAIKTPTFTQVIDSAQEAVNSLELSYQPSDDERRLRATFYTALEGNPIVDVDSATAASICQVTHDSRIYRWWSKPGFKEWFLNKVEIQAKAEFALDLLLDSFIVLAKSDDPKSMSAKVSAAKLLSDMRGYTGRTTAPKAADDDLPKDPAQLKEYIKRISAQVDKA